MLSLYRALIALRLDHPALGGDDATLGDAAAIGSGGLLVRRHGDEDVYWVVVQLHGAETFTLEADNGNDSRWEVLLTTEEPAYTADPRMPDVDLTGGAPVVRFLRPGAVILRQSNG